MSETAYQRNVAAAAAESKDENDLNAEDACVVCFKNCDIYSIGECDHPVCFECSTRMRVLCQQNECPICRQVLSKVIFTYDKLPYRELEAKNRSEYYSKKYKIGFYTNKIQQAFFDLLDHPCPKCNTPPYRTFAGLQNHVRKEHDLHYCNLCTENLKIFTFERRCYTQAELGLHRTKGDADNRSHRGHPLCEYCNTRFLDRDELFRHLRREHYFCHFCDADGCNEFYKDYDALAEHFRQDHFLCEEGKCATDQFVGAFRTDIDYKAHVANVHGKTLNKQQAKQTRTLQLEITLGPRGRSGQTEQGIANVRSRGNEAAMREELEEMESMYQNMLLQQQQPSTIDGTNEQDFPTLAGAATGPNLSLTRPPPLSMRNRTGVAGLARTKENFPALGGGGVITAAVPQRSQHTISSAPSKHRQQPPPSAPVSLAASRTKENFPALSGGGGGFAPLSSMSLRKSPGSATGAIARNSHHSASATNGMVIHVSNRPAAAATQTNGGTRNKSSTFDFPSLPAGGKSKKHGGVPRTPIDEDMGSMTPNLPMSNVSAKHRTLVDDYVSVANPSTFKKMQMVQKEELEASARKAAAAMNAPKLTTVDFPSLGGSSSTSNNNSKGTVGWLQKAASSAANEKRQRELENRKAKVAPAPLLFKDSKTQSNNKTMSSSKNNNSNNNNNNTNNNNNNLTTLQKESKKGKEKKTSSEINATPAKSNGKLPRERNNNNENKSANANTNGNNAVISSTAALRPPPGFGGGAEKPTPPPGFLSNVTVNSVAKPTNNLTFTSSLGESYSIVPTHAYVHPPEAITRNQKLVGHFKDALKTPEALEEFRHISQKFREGVYKVPAYYEHCQAALKQKFDKIFPELLVLLPDIGKQQALYLVHTQRLNTLTLEQRKSLPKLEVCGTCKQVLLSVDLDSHRKLHEHKENFPTLSSASGGGGTPARIAARK